MLKKINLIVASLFILLIITAEKCPKDYECPADPVAEVDPVHAQFSPVASQVFLQLLKSDSCRQKGNVKLFVVYNDTEYNKDSLAFFNGAAKVVLRDDGVFPDVTKNDQEYSALISLDTAELRRMYTDAASSVLQSFDAKGGGDASFISFNGREVVSNAAPMAQAQASRFNFDDFAAGIKTSLTIEFPSLETIRNKCLYVIDTRVVEDPSRVWIPSNAASNPSGAWSFKKIMQGLANTAATGVSAEDFTQQWLQTWRDGGNDINSDNIPARPGINNFIANWPKAGGKLDLEKAPFKLVAIVNRLDLMPNPIYNAAKNGGELRFVFVVMNPQNPSVPFSSGDIIFEFGVNKTGTALVDYAKKWYALKDLAVGSPEYNSKLEAITNEIISANAEPSKPNGSNLNQLRTNEIIFGGWQLREFVIDGTTHLIKGTTIKQEPAGVFNNGAATELAKLKQFADGNEQKIIRNHYTIPEKLADNTPFLGAKSDYPSGGIWGNAAASNINSNQARFVLSLNTCSGCHKDEAHTQAFLHNASVPFGTPTILSRFIRGNAAGLGNNTEHFTENDVRGVSRSFNDLARRAKVLWGFVNSNPVLFGLQYNPVNMEH